MTTLFQRECHRRGIGDLRRWTNSHTMKAFIILVLSCASVVGADTGVRVITTVRTNESGSISTKDIFTRDGQTNLVRSTSTKDGVVQIRFHRFYHGGSLVGNYYYFATQDSSAFITEAGIPYSLSFEFGPSNQLTSAVINKDRMIVDAFSCTNGLFYPAEVSRIQQANDLLGGTIGGEPVRDDQEWAKRYKEKYKIP